MLYDNIKFSGFSHRVIKTDYGWKVYLDDPTDLRIYNEWNDINVLVAHVGSLKIYEKIGGICILFVCNDDLAVYLAFTRVFIPDHSTTCTIEAHIMSEG